MSYFAPIMLTSLMFGMGLSLKVADFSRVFTLPKAALTGLIGQLLLLPLLGFGLCVVLDLNGIVAIGIMLLTLCPGGVLSNMFTLIGRGDLALSVTMTSISSLVTVFTLPFVLNLSLLFFDNNSIQLSLPFLKTASQIMMMTIIPVSIGMFVLHKAPQFAENSRKWVRRGCNVFLPLVILSIVVKNDGAWFQDFMKLGAITVLLNVLSILLGFGLGKLAGLDFKKVRTLSIEVGAQNAMLGVTIAISPFLMNNAEVALVPSIYGITMVAILWGYTAIVGYRDDRRAALVEC